MRALTAWPRGRDPGKVAPMVRWGWPLVLVLAACGGTEHAGDAGLPADVSVDAGDSGGLADAGQPADAGDPDDAGRPADGGGSRGLPRLRAADPAAAARGGKALVEDSFGGQLVPWLGIRNLWVVWDARPRDDATYWGDFNQRYGAVARPDDPVGMPYGLKVAGQTATVDCLFCHAGEVAGAPVIGAPASRVDLEGLYDDLVTLAALGPTYGFPAYPIPFSLDGFTGAAGAHDAMGLGLRLAAAATPGAPAPAACGHQRPAPWWTAAVKDRRYADGSARAAGYRTMMATLLAFGLGYGALVAQDAEFQDVDQYLVSLEPPAWPFAPPDPAAVARGRVLFEDRCAECHGRYDGPARGFPERVVPAAEVGTDPTRAACFTEAEAAWINLSWFGQPEGMTPTGGYLAPALTGVWAAAPYLHNGSVPTLAGVLDPALRPAVWRRTGSGAAHYDPAAVGWRYDTPAAGSPDTLEGRRVYDTTRPGLDNGGHDYAQGLSAAERADLLAYLQTL
ncbi:MAG: c-type cytochrome [Deltaproteobacteria bacterium]|nr:c-type cytochrome [Deltaproteobacteria bacterium]